MTEETNVYQEYVDYNLLGCGHIKEAMIVGLDGAWLGKTTDFKMTQTEVQKIIDGFKSNKELLAEGIWISGQKYIYVATPNPEKELKGRAGSGGCACAKTEFSVIIATHDEKMNPGECNKAVYGLADYLVEYGY